MQELKFDKARLSTTFSTYAHVKYPLRNNIGHFEIKLTKHMN